MRVLVQAGEFRAASSERTDNHLRQHYLVDEAGGQRGLPEEVLASPVACCYAQRVRRSFMISSAA